MCYHKASPNQTTLFKALTGTDIEIKNYGDGYYHGNGFSHPTDPVMTMAAPHLVQPYKWGFVPTWSKDKADAAKNANIYLNVTCEKMFKTYKPFWKQRCLIFCTGFFEWKWEDEAGKVKYPYFIYAPEHQVFTMAGIYNSWVDRGTGEVIHSYGIMTTPANELMAEIHNNKKRMPLILQKDNWGQWMDEGATESQVTELLKPLPEGILKAHKVTKDITKRGYDTNVPGIQQEVGELF